MLFQLCHLMRADLLERVRRPGFLFTACLVVALGHFSRPWATFALSLLGFYLVRGSLAQDERTGVGQILAATPTRNRTYLLGKVAGSFLLLLLLSAFPLAADLLRQRAGGELLATLPVLAMIAATALLFETLPWLRDGFGSALYPVLWLAVMALIGLGRKALAPGDTPPALPYLLWLAAALVTLLVATHTYRRFDTIRPRFRRKVEPAEPEIPDQNEAPVVPHVRPTPVELGGLMSDAFDAVFATEWRLLVRDRPIWWYGVAALLIGAPVVAPLGVAREVLWPIAWLWPTLRWAELGAREVRSRTEELVLTGSRPCGRQLPAAWLAGVLLAMAAGSGIFLRFVLEQEAAGIGAWTVGALFIPALALALGVWTGSTQPFAWLYALWVFGGALNRVIPLDFMGVHPEAVAAGMPLAYLALTIALLGLAVFGRARRGEI